MRSKIIVIGSIVLAGVVARDNGASACSTTDDDTDSADRQLFMCQGNPNPLPVNGAMDPRPSINFAQYGRISIDPPPGCNAPPPLGAVIFPSCTIVPCPDPGAISGTGDRQWSFFIQDNDRFHLDNNEWSGNGKSDTVFYDPNQPYSKVLNVAYLLWFGLKDDLNVQLHGTQDYVDLARANDSEWHSTFFRSMNLGEQDYGQWSRPDLFGDDQLATSCSLYDASGGMANNIVFRADTNLHEAWHAWENLNVQGGGISHRNAADVPDCQPPKVCDCTVPGDSCDFFYGHSLETFHPFGTLHNGGKADDCGLPPRDCAGVIGVPGFHSPTQIEWEFMCDLLASYQGWVTQDIRDDASTAQKLDQGYFIHTPPFDCGGAHPMMSPI